MSASTDTVAEPQTLNQTASAPQPALPGTTSDIEEGQAAYQPGGFHPVYIGDIFNDKYQVLNKIGYGVYSTVWLVKDLKNEGGLETKYRALKVLSSDCYGQGYDTFEREILTELREKDRKDLGYNYVCHLIDDFQHKGPNGVHVCFIFELMGENLRSFGSWFRENRVPFDTMRRFTIQLVLAIDYAHDCNIIHTDIKPDNIFVKFRDHSLIESGYLAGVLIPKQDRTETSYTVIRSWPLRRFYFGEADKRHIDEFDITLGDWGVSCWKTKHLSENIQPVALRAPEVLIKAPWDERVDWWNLGATVHEIFRAVRLFSGRVPPDGHYELKEHLTEMVHFFGPFPQELIKQGDPDIVAKVFDDEGNIKDPLPMERSVFTSEDVIPGLENEDKEQFASFMLSLMKINPNDRISAIDMLRTPWLNALR